VVGLGGADIAFWLLSFYGIFVVSCDRWGKELTEDVGHRFMLIMIKGLLDVSMSYLSAH
jgi:hypothetical protein